MPTARRALRPISNNKDSAVFSVQMDAPMRVRAATFGRRKIHISDQTGHEFVVFANQYVTNDGEPKRNPLMRRNKMLYPWACDCSECVRLYAWNATNEYGPIDADPDRNERFAMSKDNRVLHYDHEEEEIDERNPFGHKIWVYAENGDEALIRVGLDNQGHLWVHVLRDTDWVSVDIETQKKSPTSRDGRTSDPKP